MTAVGWQLWALLSAVFAALTAVLGKLGVEDVDPDVATFVRTLVIMVVLGGLLLMTGQKVATIPIRSYMFLSPLRAGNRRVVAMLFPRPEIGRCRAGRPARQT